MTTWTTVSTEEELRRVFAVPDKNNTSSRTTKPSAVLALVVANSGDAKSSDVAAVKACMEESSSSSSRQQNENDNDDKQRNKNSSNSGVVLTLWTTSSPDGRTSSLGAKLAASLFGGRGGSSDDGAVIVPGRSVAVAAIFGGEMLDYVQVKIDASATRTLNTESLATFCSKFSTHVQEKRAGLKPGAIAAATTNEKAVSGSLKRDGGGDSASSSIKIDILKLLELGKDLLSKRKPMYAEKFFGRAVDTLEAILPEVLPPTTSARNQEEDQNDDSHAVDVVASLADAMAWRMLARFVSVETQAAAPQVYDSLKSDAARLNALLARAPAGASSIARVPTGVVLRAEALARMSEELAKTGAAWTEAECSEKALRKRLEGKERVRDHGVRSLLCVTLFMSGDMECCLTEAIKLATLSVPFGAVAVSAVTRFLGPNHPLVQKV